MINYNAKINYYAFLLGRPRGWELLFPVGTAINRGDTVNVIEVDSGGTPTGNTMTGTVVYKNVSDFWEYKDKEILAYVVPD